VDSLSLRQKFGLLELGCSRKKGPQKGGERRETKEAEGLVVLQFKL